MVERDYFRHDFEGPRRRSFWATIPGTKGIIIGLVAIHALVVLSKSMAPAAFDWIQTYLYLSPDDVLRNFYVWQLVTAALLHDPDGLMHILFNSLMIFFMGRMVEQRLGLRRYLWFCLLAAVSASVVYILWAIFMQVRVPMVGASGTVMGMLALVALWYPTLTVMVWGVLPMKMATLALILIGIDLLFVFSTSGNVANSAHLGGALFGWLYYRYGGRVQHVFSEMDRRADRKRAHKEQRRVVEADKMRREVDRILDKVNREGLSALTEAERRYLERAGKRLRQ
ncbi:MAG: rhomboid family intramembrane serine protease [Planctomycetota bacterium]|jgi:membrane associated rhomboid family serine protease|nr:rhomboid family intramembrane serine protease [Planctomycetota bacterium]